MPAKGDGPPPTLSGLVNSSATEVAANAAICAGFEDPQKIVEFEAQWRAALMGEVDGLLEFSLNPAIDAFHAYEQADRIERYRERVLGFMHEAMAQHSAQAVANLMHAYDPGWVPMHIRGRSSNSSPMNVFLDSIKNPEPLRQVSGADAVLAYRYARLCQAVCPEFPRSEAEVVAQRLRGELEGAERERADADANRLRAQHFADAARAPWIEDIGEQREIAVSPGKG